MQTGPLFDPVFLGVVAFLAGTCVVIAAGLQRENVPAVVNGVVAVVVLAAVLGVEAWVAFNAVGDPDPEWGLSLWVAAAGCLHTIGMLGPYDSIWWWDHLTHVISAAFVAAVVYGSLLVTIEFATGDVGRWSVATATLLITMLAGVCWELIELVARELGRRFDVEPVLVNYGRRDTMLDLVFDLVGAVVILLGDVRVFVPVAEARPELTTLGFVWGLAILLGVTLALTVVILFRLQRRTGSAGDGRQD